MDRVSALAFGAGAGDALVDGSDRAAEIFGLASKITQALRDRGGGPCVVALAWGLGQTSVVDGVSGRVARFVVAPAPCEAGGVARLASPRAASGGARAASALASCGAGGAAARRFALRRRAA